MCLAGSTFLGGLDHLVLEHFHELKALAGDTLLVETKTCVFPRTVTRNMTYTRVGFFQ